MTEDIGTEVERLRAEAVRLRGEVGELRASRLRLLRLTDAERSGIERELHDGLQQQLVALAVVLQQARRLLADGQAEAGLLLLDELAEELRVAVNDCRAFALRIFPALFDVGGLRLALRTAVAGAGFPAEIRVPDDAGWSREVAVAIYFCCVAVLEQLGSSVRSVVAVREDAGKVVFEIAVLDASAGLVVKDLALAQERVEALGGGVMVMSGGERGIQVRGSLPSGSNL